MTISQTQIVDYLNKKLGYGVAKTDVFTAKSPSNESIASPLLAIGNSIWQLSANIPTLIPVSNSSVVTLYNDSLSSTVQCVRDNTTSVVNTTWATGLTDWIPPQFGSSYQVKVYAAAAGSTSPQAVGTLLPPDGSGNNDAWFFDYQSGVVNFADTNVPSAVAGNSIFVVGARYTGQKGISNFPNGLSMGNIAVTGNATIGGNVTITGSLVYANGAPISGTYSNVNVAAYLAGTITTGNIITTNGLYWANGASALSGVYGNANVSAYLALDPTITGINSNLTVLFANATVQSLALSNLSANVGTVYSNISALIANAATQQTQITSLYTNANANTAAYLLNSGPITVSSGTQATTANTGAFQVYGGASIGANLYVGGNLIIAGNTYELQTEILTQNQVVAGSVSASAYFYSNGAPFNYGNSQVAAYLATYAGSVSGSADVIALYANAALQANQITAANTRIQTLDANVGLITSNVATLFANAGGQAIQINTISSTLSTATNNIATLFANAGGQATQLQSLTSNALSLATGLYALDANVGSYETTTNGTLFLINTNVNTLLANAVYQEIAIAGLRANIIAANNRIVGGTYTNSNVTAYLPTDPTITGIQANLGSYQVLTNANLGTVTSNISTLLANTVAQEIAIAALRANIIAANSSIGLTIYSNANVSAYLLNSTQTKILDTTQATANRTGAFQVYGGASIGANLYVGGNLIIAGNTYELQTEILTQNQVVAGSIYAGGYFYANGEPFSSSNYSDANVAAYLPTYSGNLSPGNLTIRGNLFVANIVTAGQYGNITGANVVFANTFAFSSNGVNILTAAIASTGFYTNTNVAAYLTGTVTTGNLITTGGLFWSNGISALTPQYGNTQVAAYLPIHTGNVKGANLTLASNIYSGGTILQFTNGNIASGVWSGSFTPPVNNPYSFNGSYALSTTTPTAQNVTGNVALQLGGNPFCVQFWMYLTSSPTNNPIIFGKDQNTLVAPIEFYGTVTTSAIYFSTTSGLGTASSYTMPWQLNTWYHVAWTSDGTNYRTYVNGQPGNPSPVSSGVITNATGPMYVGSSARGTNYFNGYLEDFRIDKGTSVYTQAFTPPISYINALPTTVYYLKSWTSGASLSSTVDSNGFFNIRMAVSLSPATITTAGPYNTTTGGQGVLFDGTSTWYTTGGFQVRGAIPSVSTTSGALQVLGGAGIVGNLYAGNINVPGTITVGTLAATDGMSFGGNASMGSIFANGNVYANQYFFANGASVLTSIGGSYSNANVASFLPVYSGEVLASNISVTSNVTSNYLLGNLISSGNVTVGNIITVGSYGNITGANVIAANTFVFGSNGVNILSGLLANVYNNSNTAAYLTTATGNISANYITATGNITANGIRSNTNVTTVSVYSSGYFYANGVNALSQSGIIPDASNLPLGANTEQALVSNAVSLTTATTVTNAIAELNYILGKLVPNPPPNFPGSTGTLTLTTSTTSALMSNFTQTDNTKTGGRSVAGGTLISAVRSATYGTSTVTTVGPGNSGTVGVYLNGKVSGSTALTGASNGTYGNLIIANNQDYSKIVSIAPNFWYSFDARATGSSISGGWNEVYISDSATTGNTTTLTWYYDSSSPGTPAFSSTSIAVSSNVVTYSSTIPHFTSAAGFTIAGNVNNLSGDMYPNSGTLASGIAGGAFQAPTTVTYSAAGVTTPLARNLYVGSGSARFTTTANIVSSGFGSSSTGPSVSVNNSYNTGTQAFAPGSIILYKNGTSNTMEETNIPVSGSLGSGYATNGARIVLATNSDTPAYTGSESTFNSTTSTLLTYDATVVANSLKHDTTNYSTGYLPVGPNLSSGRSGAQYFTFRFQRSTVSAFDIVYSGTLAGLWISAPGTAIDSASSINGWLDVSAAYAGAGVPGANTGSGGNGSNGCSRGGTATLNSVVTNLAVTATLGTVSSSTATSNEIYVRIKLTSGQSITALSVTIPSH